MVHALALCLLGWLAAAAPALSESPPSPERNLFVFGGRITAASMSSSVDFVGVPYEDNYLLGLGLQTWSWQNSLVDIGYEGGIAHRFGEGTTTEIWAGVGLRCCRYQFRDVTLTPSLIVGLSHVDAPHPGREADQVARDGGDASLLFYFTPELELAPRHADWSVFWRLHHRSGGGKTLGNMKGAANAHVLGIRLRF